MPKSSDWGELKTNHTFRITTTAHEGLRELANSLDLPMNEMLERLGRGGKDAVMKKALWGVLTGTIVQMQNKRIVKKLEKPKHT